MAKIYVPCIGVSFGLMDPWDRRNDHSRVAGPVRCDGGRAPLDRAFEALADTRKRYVAYHLLDVGGADVQELAEHVAARECDGTVTAAPEDHAEAVRLDLYHNHLPKLDALDVVEYDRRSGAVRYRELPQAFEELATLARELDGRTE